MVVLLYKSLTLKSKNFLYICTMKRCNECNIEKELSEYFFRKDTNTYENKCKKCRCVQIKESRKKAFGYLETRRKWREKNSEKVKEQSKEQYHKHKHSEKRKILMNKFYNSDYGKFRARCKSLIRLVVNKKSNEFTNSEKVLGWTKNDFKERYGDANNLSVDHRVPIIWFEINTPLTIVNHLDNLQLLSISDNISKLSRYFDEISDNYRNMILPYIKDKFKNEIINNNFKNNVRK